MTTLTASLARAPAVPAAPWVDAGLRAALLGLLVLAPIPLGCASAEARAWCLTGLGALVLAVAAAGLWRGRALPLPPAAAAWLLFAVVPLLQLLPFGGSPTPAVLGDLQPTHVSLVPIRTLTRFGELVGLFGCYAATAVLVHKASTARFTLGALLTMATGLVVYGLLAWQGLAPLVSDEQTRTVMVATFVNRNHLANLLGMAALAGIGLFAALRTRHGTQPLLLLVATGITAAILGIVATQSRGGLVALVAGALVFALLTLRAHGRGRALAVLGIASAVAMALVVWLLPAGFASRFAAIGNELPGSGARTDIWRGAIALWQAFPWLGTGLGTFGDLSPATQSATVPGRVEHAHCDPLELLAETGLVGALLLAAAVFAYVAPMVRRCLAHSDRERVWLAAGGLAALTATAVHSLVEFHLQIPANAAWTAALAGLVAGVLRSRATTAAPRRHGWILLTLGATALGAGFVRATAHAELDGLQAIEHGRQLLASDPAGAALAAANALQQNPFSPRAHRLAGDAQLGREPGAAEASFARSLRWTNPAERPRHQLDIAIRCLGAGDSPQAARWLADLLPRQTPAAQAASLDTLYGALPIAEALLALLPTSPPDVRSTFAEVLLRRGDFAGRELALANLRGAPSPVLLTITTDVQLVAAESPATVAADGTTAVVDLRFVRTATAAKVPLVLRIEGPGAAIYRSFAVDTDTFTYTARFDTAFPPGVYTLSLDFRADAPHFPFATVNIAANDLDLRTGSTVPATQLYWTTAEPGRRIHAERSLPLRAGDVVWRRVVLPEGPCDLVLRTQLPSRLQVSFDDRDVPTGGTPATIHRVPLPAATAGTLAIRGAGDGKDEPLLRELFVTPRSRR